MEYPNRKVYDNAEITEPIAEELVNLLINKKISYLDCFEVLEIAMDKIKFTYPCG